MIKFCHIERQRLKEPIPPYTNYLWFILDPVTGERLSVGYLSKAQIIKAAKGMDRKILPAHVKPEHYERLQKFARETGTYWKSKLVEMWARGEDANDPLLRQLRNNLGPAKLQEWRF